MTREQTLAWLLGALNGPGFKLYDMGHPAVTLSRNEICDLRECDELKENGRYLLGPKNATHLPLDQAIKEMWAVGPVPGLFVSPYSDRPEWVMAQAPVSQVVLHMVTVKVTAQGVNVHGPIEGKYRTEPYCDALLARVPLENVYDVFRCYFKAVWVRSLQLQTC